MDLSADNKGMARLRMRLTPKHKPLTSYLGSGNGDQGSFMRLLPHLTPDQPLHNTCTLAVPWEPRKPAASLVSGRMSGLWARGNNGVHAISA
jgi:hypothetical protein